MTARKSTLLAAALSLGIIGSPALATEPLKVVASFSILGDLVAEVGREHVEVRTLVGPNGDSHVYAPTPADARDTAAAGLVVVNGLGFEGWLDRLVNASGYAGRVAVASEGVIPINLSEHEAAGMPAEEEGQAAGAGQGTDHDHDVEEAHGHEGGEGVEHHEEAGHHHGDIDPHAWQSVANTEIYVKNIVAALCEADRGDCADYRANGAAYAVELQEIDASIKAGFAAIPTERRKVITTHDAFGYFAREYGIEFLAPQGVSTESEASAGDVARLIEQIRTEGVTAIFVENISDPRLMEQIAGETGIRPGGELYSDALSEPDGPAATYAVMMRHNANLLQSAMLGS